MRIAVPLCLLALLLRPSPSQAQRIDHLEVLEPPRLVDCDNNQPYFRVVVNAVDADRQLAAIGLSAAEAKKKFQVVQGNGRPPVVYVGLSDSGGASSGPGTYVMLLLDTSGSMNQRLPSAETRFVAAKAAVSRSLQNFAEGTDHIAVVPFDSHDVVSRIRGAVFQSTRQGIDAQLAALPAPRTNNNTALYSAISEALPILKQQRDAGFVVSLVVFSDGENDVNHPGDDRGLLGSEGLAKVKELAAQLKVPITTVGFGVSTKAAVVSALTEMAWPNSDSYYNAETSAERLGEVFAIARKKLTDRIQILFGPVGTERERLTGQSLPFLVRLTTDQGTAATRSALTWNAPAVGVPVYEGKCTDAELRALLDEAPSSGGTSGPPVLRRLLVLAMFSGLLAAMWFGAPRFVWPESYIPKPTFQRPTTSIPEVDALRGPSFPQPRGGQRPPSPATSSPRGGPAPGPRRPPPQDQTIVIPPRSAARSGAPPPRSAPRAPEPPASRAADDETIFRPVDKDPGKGH